MSSKIPVTLPYRRDASKFLTPKKEDEGKLHKSSSFACISPGDSNKKTSINRFKNVRSKVNTHWSPEEKQRSGLSTYFARKDPNSCGNSLATSPEMQRQAMKITNRNKQSIAFDPIAQLKVTTTSPSPSCSSTNSSFASLPEWPVSHD